MLMENYGDDWDRVRARVLNREGGECWDRGAEEGQDWVLTYTPEKRDESNREKVLVRLTPQALDELYIETKNLSTDQRMHGHSAEYNLCGEQVDLDKAIPNPSGEPYHKRRWAE